MTSLSQHRQPAQRRVKSPLHALHAAIVASNATAPLSPGADLPETAAGDVAATSASPHAPAAANAAAADGFTLIAPVGSWSHSVGQQLVDSTALASMVSRFNGAIARVARFFGSAAVPVYRGHPDDAQFGNDHEDTTRYGEVRELQARPDGLYARIEWAEAGNELLSGSQKLFFSPRWLMSPARIDSGRTAYRPSKLLSVGLTPTPNIAGAAANEQQPQPNHQTMDLLKKILIALGFTEAQAAAAAANEATAPSDIAVLAAIDKIKADLAAANEAKTKADADLAAANAAKSKAEGELATANTAHTAAIGAANARIGIAAKLVADQAVKAGAIEASNAQAEADLLLGHNDFAAAANALLARKQVIHTQATVSANGRTGEGVVTAANAAANEFEAKVTAIAANEKVSRSEAWTLAKTRHADLYTAMSAKAEA